MQYGFILPHGVVHTGVNNANPVVFSLSQRHPGLDHAQWKVPLSE